MPAKLGDDRGGAVMITVDAYLARIPPLHAGKPKFSATIALCLQPFVDAQNFLASLPDAFDLDQAIGVQLDAVGEWVGISRIIPVPIADPWMSCDDPIRGLDHAPLYVPAITAGNTYVSLDDDTYRRLLRAKIAANSWDGTAAGAQSTLAVFFSAFPGTHVFVQDNGDMTMTIGVSGVVPPIVDLEIIGQNLIPVKPPGVSLDAYVTSVSGAPIAGCDVENEFISGCDVGALGVSPAYAVQNIS